MKKPILFISLGMILIVLTACQGSTPKQALLEPTETLKPTLTTAPQPTATIKPTLPSTSTSINPTSSPPLAKKVIPKDHFLYHVQEGDTLSTIAENFNISLDYLSKINNLDSANLNMQPGDVLFIPLTCKLPGPQTNMPGYYQPHPALIRLASPSYWSARWIDDTHAAFGDPNCPNSCAAYRSVRWIDDTQTIFIHYWKEDECDFETKDVFDLPEDLSEIKDTNTVLTGTLGCTTPTPLPDIPGLSDTPEFENIEWSIAPDGNKALVTAWLSKSLAPTARLNLANEDTDDNYYEQGWLVNLPERRATPLFYSTEFFLYTWADDSRHLVGIGSCYGMVGSGLFTLDTQTSKVYTINDYDSRCEGGTGPLIAPGSGHMIYQSNHGTVVTLDGTQRVSICDENEFPRSYTWSQDGRYAYFACSGEVSDILRRYDTQTGQVISLTDPAQVTFKAMQLFLSPDQSRLMFIWGTNDFSNAEPCGIWLLDLKKLGN